MSGLDERIALGLEVMEAVVARERLLDAVDVSPAASARRQERLKVVNRQLRLLTKQILDLGDSRADGGVEGHRLRRVK